MNLIDKDTLKRNLCTNTKYRTYSECTDGSEVIFTSREIDSIIDEQSIISIISENNPLTLDEVKALKEGDVVWLKDECGIQCIRFVNAGEMFLYFYDCGDARLAQRFISGLNHAYKIYRNKPTE